MFFLHMIYKANFRSGVMIYKANFRADVNVDLSTL